MHWTGLTAPVQFTFRPTKVQLLNVLSAVSRPASNTHRWQAKTMKLYDIILADPPWNHGSPGWFGGAKNHYPTMSLDDICALPIPAADNCALFMWGCWSLMPEAFEVIKAWGFEYKTEAWVWVKLWF